MKKLATRKAGRYVMAVSLIMIQVLAAGFGSAMLCIKYDGSVHLELYCACDEGAALAEQKPGHLLAAPEATTVSSDYNGCRDLSLSSNGIIDDNHRTITRVGPFTSAPPTAREDSVKHPNIRGLPGEGGRADPHSLSTLLSTTVLLI